MANFKNLFLSFFLVLALGLALVHASEPRGPKITNKVSRQPSTAASVLPSPLLDQMLIICVGQVYFDIEYGDEQLGRVVLGLYGKTVPEVIALYFSILRIR
jgi:peptidyl-prolyl cis-trans isomerase B (cyclophilin B)